MNSIHNIDYIYSQMEKTHNCLSKILPQIYPFAIECEDYEGLCIFFWWNSPTCQNPSGNSSQFEMIEEILLKAGLNQNEIKIIKASSFEHYLGMRYVEKDKVCSLSAQEMEDYFVRADNMITATDVPKELHPVDLYFRSEAATKQKLTILQTRQMIEKQYAILRNFITSKLAYYRLVITQKERKMDVQKGIRNSKKIFIIHGHSEAKRRELEVLLKENFELDPVILSDQPNQGMTIIEKFEKYASECSYAFALFTPDDIVTAADGNQYFQARPNVIFELGWFYANLGRSRVCILDQASEKSSIFSDLQGVMRIQFSNDINEKYIEIERELRTVGII